MKEKKGRRILMSVLGVAICGVSVGMFKRAELGVDPFQSLMSGLDVIIPISFGTLYLIANAVLLSFSLIFDRKKIGIATLVNLLFLGYIAEYSQKLLEIIFPQMNLIGRLLLLLAAVVIMCLASAFYFTANLGVSTYDALALVISERQNKVPFKFCRIIGDVICVCVGAGFCLLGGYTVAELWTVIGIGTIITAFLMGPLIDYFNVHVARPFLEK